MPGCCGGYHEMDLDWMLKKMKEYDSYMKDNFKSALDEYFNSIMVDASYNEETETIILKKELIVDATSHTYNADGRSMIIE